MQVTPRYDEEAMQYRIGVGFSRERPRAGGAAAALVPALTYPARRMADIAGNLYTVIRGRERGELSGPVGIIEVPPASFAERSEATLTLAIYEALLLLLLDLVMAIVALSRRSRTTAAA